MGVDHLRHCHEEVVNGFGQLKQGRRYLLQSWNPPLQQPEAAKKDTGKGGVWSSCLRSHKSADVVDTSGNAFA